MPTAGSNPPVDADLFDRLAREVGAWSETYFGDQPAVNPLLGVGEELGELADHLASGDGDGVSAVAADAATTHDPPTTDPPTTQELDSVGDALVFLADFCHRRGIAFGDAVEDATVGIDEGAGTTPTGARDDPLTRAMAALGRLHRSVLKRRQGIRLDEDRIGRNAEREAVGAFAASLAAFADARGYALDDCVRVAWDDEVSDREWDSRYVDGE
jgi:hypothetical protein